MNGWIATNDVDKKLLLGVIKNLPKLMRERNSTSLLISPRSKQPEKSLFDQFCNEANNDEKDYFKAERLKTRTERDYLATMVKKPV